MINAAETQPPKAQIGQKINAGETIPPGGSMPGEQSIRLLAGESVADSYIISALLENKGKQADVYIAKKWGKSYVVKIYHNGWHPSGPMQSFLISVRHPNIAHVVESGEHSGHYYEIYEYYPEGTIEEADALSMLHIQNVIVPSINEGLHELHRNGIVHCDIKPSNLFYTDGGNRVVIGDCGISGYANTNGKLIDTVRGTPEYAPRVRALLWSASMSPAYDYGSFGLVLCKAVLGRSLFAGMSVEEISKAWDSGLELPSQINGRMGALIRGLINEDEEQRWGYIQVKRWCEGEYMRPANRSIYARAKKESKNRPLIFGRFDGQMLSVSTMHQLAKAAEQHWSQATHIVKRRELVEFIRQFDRDIADKVRELALYQDSDAAVSKLLMYIGDEPQKIVYCGKVYETLAQYAEQLSSGKDDVAKRFLTSGLLVFHLRQNGYPKAQVDKLESLIKKNNCEDMASILTICYALQGKKAIDVFGVSVDSLESLIPVLCRYSIQEIDDLLRNDDFMAWLNHLGYEKEVRKIRGSLINHE